MRLGGKTALVTGAGRNIGKAIAMGLAEAGADVVCTWLDAEEHAVASARAIEHLGRRSMAIRMDLRDVFCIRSRLSEIGQTFGPVDILVNCAATRPRRKINDVSPSEWDMVMETNVRGPFFLSQAVIPEMKARGWGRIINIGGIDSQWGNPQRPHSVASKGALSALTRALANETARWGITVNSVTPGGMKNASRNPAHYPNLPELEAARINRVPMGRLGAPENVADACVFLASDGASYITGQEVFVTGGAYPLVRQTEVEY